MLVPLVFASSSEAKCELTISSVTIFQSILMQCNGIRRTVVANCNLRLHSPDSFAAAAEPQKKLGEKSSLLPSLHSNTSRKPHTNLSDLGAT